MRGIIAAIVAAFSTDAALLAAFPGGLTHGTVSQGTPRPRVSFRVIGRDASPVVNTSQRYQQESVRVLFIASCLTDAAALGAVDLLEKRMPGLVGEFDGGRVYDAECPGKSVDEMPDPDSSNGTIWEGSIMIAYKVTRDRLG